MMCSEICECQTASAAETLCCHKSRPKRGHFCVGTETSTTCSIFTQRFQTKTETVQCFWRLFSNSSADQNTALEQK